jgi:hypothetical protein
MLKMFQPKQDVCKAMSSMNDIKKQQYPYTKTLELLVVYIPDIYKKFADDVKQKVILSGKSGKELDDFKVQLVESYIVSYFIDNAEKCKKQKEAEGKKVGGKKHLSKKMLVKNILRPRIKSPRVSKKTKITKKIVKKTKKVSSSSKK